MKSILRLGVILLPVLLTACNGLIPRAEPVDIYRLPTSTALEAQTPAGSASDTQLRVNTPQASGLLADKRIVIIPDDSRISVYHGARWNQPTPQLLRDHIIQAFRDSGRLHAVIDDDSSLHADYTLSGTLQAFQAESRGQKTPSVVISFDAVLIRHDDQYIIATKRIDIVSPTASTALPAVVDALGKATDQLNAQLTHWVFEQIAKDKGSQAKP